MRRSTLNPVFGCRIGVRNRVVVQFDSGLKALRVSDVEACPGSEFDVDSFPHFTDEMLDVWASLINSAVQATAERPGQGTRCMVFVLRVVCQRYLPVLLDSIVVVS